MALSKATVSPICPHALVAWSCLSIEAPSTWRKNPRRFSSSLMALVVMSARLGSFAGRWFSTHVAGALPLPVDAAGPLHSTDIVLGVNRPSTGLRLSTLPRPAASVTYW